MCSSCAPWALFRVLLPELASPVPIQLTAAAATESNDDTAETAVSAFYLSSVAAVICQIACLDCCERGEPMV